MKSDKVSNLLGMYLLGALLGAGVLGYFVIRPLVNSGQANAAQVKTENQKIAALHQLDKDTQTLRVNYAKVKGQRDAILQLLPVQSEEERLLALLNDLAVSSGVVLSSFSPTQPTANAAKLTSVSVYPVSLNVAGSYTQIQQFLNKVENSARFIDVRSTNESGGAAPGAKTVALNVVLNMDAYYQGSGQASSGPVAVTGASQ